MVRTQEGSETKLSHYAKTGRLTFRLLFAYPVRAQLKKTRRHELTHFSTERGTTDSP